MNRIIGIDPGTRQGALVVWDNNKIEQAVELDNDAILAYARKWTPGATIACEKLECFGMPVGAEVFETAYWIGRLMEVVTERAIDFRLVSRRDVKMHFCGTMRAKDGNVAQALRDRFGEKGTKRNPGALYGVSGHCWQALAIAVYVDSLITNSQ